jgi:hypothetical protein
MFAIAGRASFSPRSRSPTSLSYEEAYDSVVCCLQRTAHGSLGPLRLAIDHFLVFLLLEHYVLQKKIYLATKLAVGRMRRLTAIPPCHTSPRDSRLVHLTDELPASAICLI